MATMNQVGVSLSGANGADVFVGSSDATIWSPTLITPELGVPSSGDISACTNLSWGNSGGGITLNYISGTLTAAQIKTLVASPVEVISAPGSGVIHLVNQVVWKYNYVAPAYTASSSQTIRLLYSGSGGVVIVSAFIVNSVLIGSANSLNSRMAANLSNSTGALNQSVILVNPTATEVTNGNGYVDWFIWYTTVDVT